MVASVLDGFLYAIYNGTLVVDVDGIIISKDSLADFSDYSQGILQRAR